MRKLTIKSKITLWFSAALIIVAALAYFTVFFISAQVISKNTRDNLIETVEYNLRQVDYSRDTEDGFLKWGEGYIAIDEHFLENLNQVYVSLCYKDGNLIYGENPLKLETDDLPFQNSVVQDIKVNGKHYYVFDLPLEEDGLDGVWLRGVVSSTQGDNQMASIVRTSLILLPSIEIVAIIGGYLIAKKMLRPITEITETASQISEGNHLERRLPVHKQDELGNLAESFNQMFSRLDVAFKNERRFTSDASHELRTPMSVIMAQCELLQGEVPLSDYKEGIEVISRQSEKMNILIEDMLINSRLSQSGRYPLEKINLSQVVLSVTDDMSLINKNEITLTSKIAKDVFIEGNASLITRLTQNLISNAYRYGKEKGKIKVTLDKDALLTVTDNGIGIAQEHIDKIFERFYQADPSRTNEGSGLGLSMVKQIANLHSAEIKVESKIGKGSTFKIFFQKI